MKVIFFSKLRDQLLFDDSGMPQQKILRKNLEKICVSDFQFDLLVSYKITSSVHVHIIHGYLMHPNPNKTATIRAMP